MNILGEAKIKANLQKITKKMESDFEKGLTLAGLRLLRESQLMVPVDTGNLKGSGFVQKNGAGFKTKVDVGYTAFYALWVHEAPMTLQGKPRPGGRGRFWDPQGRAQNKFLEKPSRTFAETAVKIMTDTMKLK